MFVRLLTLGLFAVLLNVGSLPSAQDRSMDDEQQIGQQAFDQLKAKGEIVESSPLYDQLTPIAAAITRTAQPRYVHPFKFYLVHEQHRTPSRRRAETCTSRTR
jgi:hypothetical protein